MKIDTHLDYTMPYMAAQQALKKLQDAMLEKRYEDAKLAAIDAIAEVKLTLNSIVNEEEIWKNKNFIPRG